ncbi:LEM domain-containing protein 1 isoform X1 [Periophthalmus magnuspinnatus]|uniref:LEM domain-containing protein 1 isoform X1 n=1 Tax=Periophthalmus magnuspinnatus TaxID=409849 RepID=UPI0024369ED4|nr:LEM domain-containing protein 1 isoform X1 [Periophthalmus magnuspinnatus]
MPVFAEDSAQLTKARLKSDLVAHSVTLPPTTSRKEVYVELHAAHVQRKSADFSSDEEPEAEEEPNDAQTLDPSSLTDDGLKAALLRRGVRAGPVVASTRGLYERKLRNLLLSNGHDKEKHEEDGADEAVLYSDSEEEENSEEEREEPVTEEVQTQTDPAAQSRQDCSSHSEDRVYPQCFLLSSRLRLCAPKNAKPRPKQNPRNVFKSSQLGRSRSGVSRAPSIDQPSRLATGAPAPDPVEERFKDLLVDTPTGIYASRRRPIKGAAARPVQYIYPDTALSPASPLSPASLERQEVERRLVSLRIQLLVFLFVAIILYVVYVCVEDFSFNPVLALIDVFDQGLDADEPETQEVEEFLEVE